MRRMMAIAFGCALMIGINLASSDTIVRGEQPPTHGATSADGAEVDDASQTPPACVQASDGAEVDDASQTPPACVRASDGAEVDDASQTPPACVQASQCVEYCAGGIPLCIAKHCACAS